MQASIVTNTRIGLERRIRESEDKIVGRRSVGIKAGAVAGRTARRYYHFALPQCQKKKCRTAFLPVSQLVIEKNEDRQCLSYVYGCLLRGRGQTRTSVLLIAKE